MSTIPRAFIDDLLHRVDIVEVIESYITLKKQGQNYVACCPFHQEKTPSFSVSQTKQIFHCFGCGVGGNAISFLMDYDHFHFVEAVTELARRAGVEVPRDQTHHVAKPQTSEDYQALSQATHYYQQQLKSHPKRQQAVTYLQQRGISGQIAKRFGLGFAPPGWDNLLSSTKDPRILASWKKTGMTVSNEQGKNYDRFRHRIMFPIRNRRGQVVGFGGRILNPEDTPKYLNSSESSVFQKSKTLYGLYELMQANPHPKNLLVVEGYLDVLMLAEHGIDQSVATLGTATSADHIQLLLRVSKNIVFCFDGDTAGQQAAWRALQSSFHKLRDEADIRFLFLPEGEDPDSLIQKIGKTEFESLIEQAIGLPEYFINHLSSQHNLQTMAGKSALLSRASQLLAQMPDIHLKAAILDELAKATHVSIERLPQFMQSKTQSATPTKNHTLKNLAPPIRSILALLVQTPSLIERVPEQLNLPDEKPAKLWHQIKQYLQQSSHLSTAALVEHWRDQPDADIILALSQWPHPAPPHGVEAEFDALIQHFQKQGQFQELESLLAQARQQALKPEDRQRLADLIRQKQLKNGEKNS